MGHREEGEVNPMAKKGMQWYDWVAVVIVIVGALNWGLVGFFKWNLVEAILGIGSTMTRIVYGLVGIAGLYSIFSLYKAGR